MERQPPPPTTNPTRKDYVFVGWYSDGQFTNKYDFTTPVTSSFTLYAKWGIGITSDTVASVIAGLSGVGPHTLVATGEWSSDNLSTLAEKLKDENKKVNLDLSGVEELTTIGQQAFYGCSSLTSITIPSSVTKIEGDAFWWCSNLATVTFGEGSKLETIWSFAFQGCSSLTSITIPSSVTTIGDYAFDICSSLTSINIPASVTTIGDGAFVSCSSLNISVNENNTTYSSEDGMILNKEKTILIAYPSAKGTVTNVPTSVTTIGKLAFAGCSNLATVTMEATEPPTLYDAVFNKTSAGLQILVPNDSEEAYKNATTDKGWDSYKDKIKAKE